MSSTKALLLALVLGLLAIPAAAQQPVQVVSETGGVVAGTPADAETNTEPFLARAGMRGYFFNGTTWDRMRGDTTSGLWVNVKNASLSVTGSGTFTTNQTGWNGTAVDTNSGAKSAGTLRVVIATDQPQLTSKLLVTPDSVALPANQSVNAAQFGGTNVSTGTGAGGAGIPRVTISNDSSLAANQSVNVAQMNGVATTMGAGATGTGVQRVNDVASAATGAAPPAAAIFVGGLQSGATGGFLGGIAVADTFKGVNVSTATTTLMVTGVSGRQVRVSSFHLVTAAANNVQWISGTGATCGTGTTGIGGGGTSAASGYNFAANGGIAVGNGLGQVFTTTATGDSLCIVTSAATQLSGIIAYSIY